MPADKVYIVILNYKKWQDTQECLTSLLHSSYKNFSTIVIDNDSQNDSLQHLMDWMENVQTGLGSYPAINTQYAFLKKENIDDSINPASFAQTIFIQNNINAGFAGGVNFALRFLQHMDAYVWLLNPDMVVNENTLEELIRFASLQTHQRIIGTEIRSYRGNRELLFYGGGRINFLTATIRPCKRKEDISKLDYISGGSLFTHASNFAKLGLLPEKYFLYWEETDWCYRAKQAGCQLEVCTSAVCYDKISSVIGKSFLADYYYTRNGLLFIKKYRKRNIFPALFFVSLRFLKRVITMRWKRAGGLWKGTLDFLKLQHDESK